MACFFLSHNEREGRTPVNDLCILSGVFVWGLIYSIIYEDFLPATTHMSPTGVQAHNLGTCPNQ